MSNQSPFLDVTSFVAEEAPLEVYQAAAPPSTPFLTLYQADQDGDRIDPETEEYAVFVNELYDEEFNQALDALVSEATALVESESLLDQEHDYQLERMLEEHFEPLVQETEAMIDALAAELGQREVTSLTESEIDALVERYSPPNTFSPASEQLFGGFKKALKKVVRKAASAVTKVGLGPILNRLKPIARQLLNRVLKKAIGKLPQSLQPIARKLARRFGVLKEVEEEESLDVSIAPLPDASELQLEFIEHTANLLFAPTELEMDLEIVEAQSEAQGTYTSPLSDLDRAREQFVRELGSLQEGEDPAPYIENFIPALLPALKLGIRLAGRKRVVRFLAQFLARLIRRYVGKRNATLLSRAIVDAGLRLIHLEATPEDEARAAGTAVADTVEETVRRVAALPGHVLDSEDPALLEAFALEAFEQSAAANLPLGLPAETYQQRPELLEARRIRGIWLRKPRRRYKKFSKVLRARISPHKAARIRTFAGETLEDYFQDQLGLAPGDELDAHVHLYESTEGTLLSDLVRQEGLGVVDPEALLHPLTPEVAGLLFEEPGLGREVDVHYLASPHAVEAGQRFYYLETAGQRPLKTLGPGGKAQIRRRTRVKLRLDFPQDRIRIALFLGEARAQRIAVRLRRKAHVGTIVASLNKVLQRGVRGALHSGLGRLKLIHPAVVPGRTAAVLRRLPAQVPQALAGQLQAWTLKALSAYFREQAPQFIKATEDAADGVTLTIAIASPPGFGSLRQALRGKMPSFSSLRFDGAAPKVSIKTTAGYQDA